MSTEKDRSLGLYDMTKPARFLHPALLEAKPYIDPKTKKPKGDPKFGGVWTFEPDHPDLDPMKRKAIAVARAEWGESVDLKSIEWPFKSGDKMAAEREQAGKKADLYKGKAVLKSRSIFEPMCSWIENGVVREVPSKELGPAASKFFNGVDALATFKFVPVEMDGKRYITAYLNKLFSTGKGERVQGGRSAAEAFKGYIGKSTTENPTAGGSDLDDDIPF
jgi:hypothetical protein